MKCYVFAHQAQVSAASTAESAEQAETRAKDAQEIADRIFRQGKQIMEKAYKWETR